MAHHIENSNSDCVFLDKETEARGVKSLAQNYTAIHQFGQVISVKYIIIYLYITVP